MRHGSATVTAQKPRPVSLSPPRLTFPPSQGLPEAVVASVRDGIDELIVTFADNTTLELPVADRAVFHAPPERAAVSIAREDAGGRRHSLTLRRTGTPTPPPRGVIVVGAARVALTLDAVLDLVFPHIEGLHGSWWLPR